MKQSPHNNRFEKVLLSILIVLIPILSTSLTLDPNLHLQFISLTVIVLIFWIVILIKKKGLNIQNTTVFYFLIIFVLFIAYSILSVVISNNHADAVFFFSKYVLFFLLTLLFLYFENPENLFQTVSRSAVVLSIIILIPAYFQLIELINEKELIIPLSTYNIDSLFPHRNLFSEMLLLALPFSVYSFFNEKSYWKYAGIISFNFSLFMLIVLTNRASWIGLIAIGITVLIILLLKKQLFNSNKSRNIFIINTSIIALASLLFLSAFSDTSSLKSHTLNTLNYSQGSTKDRLELWSRTVKMIAQKPVFGGGLGSWEIDMLKYGNKGLMSEDNTTFYQRPHNDFLWIAAEQGIIGVIFYISLFVIVIISLLNSLFHKDGRHQTNQLLVILSVTSGFAIVSLFSFPIERISHNIMLYTSWGLFLSMLNTKSERNLKKAISFKSFSYYPVFILIFVLLIGLIRFNSEIHTKNAILAKKNSMFQKCINEISKAESWFYTIDATSAPINWYSGLAYYKLGNYTQSVEEFKKAMLINPYHIYTLNDYAGSLTKTNQNEKAIELYNKATAVAPNFQEPKLNLCAIYFNEGKYSDAFMILKTTDTTNNSERYQKTVTAIIKKILDEDIKTGRPNTEIIQLYQKEHTNYNFYKELLCNAIKFNLDANKLIIQSTDMLNRNLKK
jgi:O-antigen ligase